jgi:hypothetical protein
MGKRRIKWTEVAINKRIKQGYGRGSGTDYKPWIRVQDFASRGRIHRVLGMKTNRVHHLFSDLEANAFHLHDFHPLVSDIREQYPLLPLEETIAIAEECGIVHPSDPYTRCPIVMTTDQFVTFSDATGDAYRARTIKYKKDLSKLRVLEKLEIERRYWKTRHIDWEIVSECEINTNVVANIKWIRPYFRISDLYPLSYEFVTTASTSLAARVSEENSSLVGITSAFDRDSGASPGTGLAIVRYLLANRVWVVDMTKRIQPSERLEVTSVSTTFHRSARQCA